MSEAEETLAAMSLKQQNALVALGRQIASRAAWKAMKSNYEIVAAFTKRTLATKSSKDSAIARATGEECYSVALTKLGSNVISIIQISNPRGGLK
jgi:hypothetical protein